MNNVPVSGTAVITYSNIQSGYSGTGNINADPLFVRYPWTGPDGLFGTADDDFGDLRLRPGSPALNVGANAAVPADVSTDLAGNARIQDDTVDLGAYEGSTAPLLRTFYVDGAATGGANNGLSWSNAFTSLHSALAAASAEDTIRVADGTYKPTSTTGRTLSFSLRDGVAIYGGYAGHGAPDPSMRNIALYVTAFSGDIGVVGNSADNVFHVITAFGMGASAVLDGVTVTGGNADGNDKYESCGGGLYAFGSSPTLINCTFTGNSATGTVAGGGAVSNSYSSPTLINCIFIKNVAYSGGGMYNTTSSPTLLNCTFSGNLSGLSNAASSSPRLINCVVWGNAGRAITNSSSTAIVTCSNIQGGYSGIGNIDADPLFVRSPWTGPDGVFNTADDDLGDLRLRPGSPMLNVGSNAAVPSGLSTDLAGNARIQDGTVDMGAYEGTAVPPDPRTFYVDAAATTGASTGSSWADAFTGLQSALTVAADGDTIRIADGTYRPTTTADRALSFVLRNAVAIHGGYAGHGAADPDARNTTLCPTILSGDIGTAGSNTDNSYHVVTANGVGASTLLDGITITAGNANGSFAPLNQMRGGGLFATSASLRLVDCTFNGNSANSGGGMYSDSSSPTLANCTFSKNLARDYGGGIYNASSSSTLVNCTFSGNSAPGTNARGGGMYNSSSSPALTNCIFSGNSAGSGGGLYNSSSSSPLLVNCTFSGNSAVSGSGMYNSASSPALTNCILWGNAGGAIGNSYSTPLVTYSNIQGGYAGTGNIDADPLFVRNPSPGPDGLWNGIDNDYGDLRLQPNSPCIDAGNNTAAGLAGITADLAGRARFADIPDQPDTGVGTPPVIDMGAYEAQWQCPSWLDPAGLANWDSSTQTLDIGDSGLVVAADDSNRDERLTAVRQCIASARSGGAGIVSSAAAEDQGVIAAFDAEGNILVRLALIGDVTLDDQLDGDDYFALDRAFLAGGGFEPAADLNLDGAIDGRDYLMLDMRFLRSAAGTIQQSAALPLGDPMVQQPAAPFSARSIADELLIEDDSVLLTAI